MKVLNPDDYVVMEIDGEGTEKFEAFLDRNFPTWREKEIFRSKNGGTIRRKWSIGIDGVERNAIYRKCYVEVYDEHIDLDDSGDATIEYLKNTICDIAGDRTSVAVWGRSAP